MIIERIQVEEGFLDGLDLAFKEGLNVLIGPRGTGKTSVIELIRFCLGATALTDRVDASSKQHALSILGTGAVTITVNTGSESFLIKRSADHWTQEGSATTFVPPVMLSQNEIESVGLHSSGRLRLIDSISPSLSKPNDVQEEAILAQIRSQTHERRSTAMELQTLKTQAAQLAEQLKESDSLKKSHADALQKIHSAQKETQRLATLTGWLASLSVRTSYFGRVLNSLQNQENRLLVILNEAPDFEVWPESAGGEDPTAAVQSLVTKSREAVTVGLDKIREAIKTVQKMVLGNQQQTLQFDEESRAIRRQLESLQQGAGETAKKLAALHEKTSQQTAINGLIKARATSLKQIQEKRKLLLDELENIRLQRFHQRSEVIKTINKQLGPRIKVSIERAGVNAEYTSAIIAALRGSGLRFNEAAPLIADQMSPREFVEAVENDAFETIAEITGLAESRCAKIVERLNDEGVENILTAQVEDGITLSLLDGTDYKTTENLSTGQRCTVVLPLLLMQHSLSLIVDQPEDHLDNAFIVETLVKAINRRKKDGQLIFSTHNANIPVIGEADHVVLLGSDGSRGFVQHAAPLDDSRTVSAITSIMEGGIQAFDRRSDFYHKVKPKAV